MQPGGRILVRLGLIQNDADQVPEQTGPLGQAISHEQTEIQGDLIVAGAARVQLLSRRADQFRQTVLVFMCTSSRSSRQTKVPDSISPQSGPAPDGWLPNPRR